MQQAVRVQRFGRREERGNGRRAEKTAPQVVHAAAGAAASAGFSTIEDLLEQAWVAVSLKRSFEAAEAVSAALRMCSSRVPVDLCKQAFAAAICTIREHPRMRTAEIDKAVALIARKLAANIHELGERNILRSAFAAAGYPGLARRLFSD